MRGEGAVLQLASLLKSGIPAQQAREELEQDLRQLSPRQQSQLQAIWELALRNGGSVSGSVESLGETFRITSQHEREVELTFAGPKATAKLVAWLPGAGLLLAQLFGLGPIHAILTNPLAFGCFVLGALLMVGGHRWSRSIIRHAKPKQDDPGLFFDAVRFGMDSGMPLSLSLERAEEVFERHLNFVPEQEMLERLNRISELNRSSGASIASLLQGEAAARREEQWFAESTTLSRLAVKLMIPLGLITLPAFVLSSIVPVAISLLSNGQNL